MEVNLILFMHMLWKVSKKRMSFELTPSTKILFVSNLLILSVTTRASSWESSLEPYLLWRRIRLPHMLVLTFFPIALSYIVGGVYFSSIDTFVSFNESS